MLTTSVYRDEGTLALLERWEETGRHVGGASSGSSGETGCWEAGRSRSRRGGDGPGSSGPAADEDAREVCGDGLGGGGGCWRSAVPLDAGPLAVLVPGLGLWLARERCGAARELGGRGKRGVGGGGGSAPEPADDAESDDAWRADCCRSRRRNGLARMLAAGLRFPRCGLSAAGDAGEKKGWPGLG